MSREPKLTKWSIEHALLRFRTVSEAARQLGVDRRTLQRSLKRLGVDKDAVLKPIAAPHAAPAVPLLVPAAPKYATPPPEPAPSVPGERKHELDGCWCGKQHRVPASFFPDSKPATNALALSYAPRRPRWQR